MATPSEVNDVLKDLTDTWYLHPYDAFHNNFACLGRLANFFDAGSEHRRYIQLLESMPTDRMTSILGMSHVDELLNVKPSIGTILKPHERDRSDEVLKWSDIVKKKRDENPKEAIGALYEILKVIRNAQSHHFKTREGPRDKEILGNGAQILRDMVMHVAEQWPEPAREK